jgi:flagellar biosynthetic protein FliR
MTFTEATLSAWLGSFLWPLMRIASMIVAAPIFSARTVPVRFRVLLAIMITWIVMPVLPPAPVVETLGHEAFLMALQQVGIGLMMGFILQMVFAALIFGGQVLAYSMGLGFASMMDPQNGVQVPVISQYFVILATLTFLLLNGHLILIQLVVDSFQTLPVAVDGITRNSLWELASWGSRIFAGGLLMALPAVAALLLVNLGMGIITRAAPQLNIFAVGFPMTLLMGFILMWLTVPNVLANFGELLNEGFQLVMRNLLILR